MVSPAHFVAPLLCAGVTMYGALKKVDKSFQEGDSVVIMGAGGGPGHFVQIGKEMGYRIIAVDSESKRDICLHSDATAFVDPKEDVEKKIRDITDGLGLMR
ncbi:alcohol dehydrogenase, putative [Paecilomyces variotii No. 5]|uniref:Alcohol dehydrogenase, putative n=1 Tax=Byssochlamys spectabilis (strain No. 5 / NBRC 109023) TaxID=1356009 RepID=V5FT84_BYSSN|nr:alcohol dehydrogenase, putative [Paecilomyces variotii No. 5]